MKQYISAFLLIAAFCFSNSAQAQLRDSRFAWGLGAGGAQGGNDAGDIWMLQYRGYLQFEVLAPALIGQAGVGYTELRSPNVYSVETAMADFRLLFSPFSLPTLHPFVYAGFGVSKSLNISGSGFLPMIPVGIGVQTNISRGVLLSVSGGYNLSLTDKLDGRERTATDMNEFTNQRHDGFYGFTVGVAFNLGASRLEAAEKEKALADADARRAKDQADAQAEAGRVKEASDAEASRIKATTDAEARRVRELSDAEARRVQQQSDANAEAMRVRSATDAEARRVKDLADAEARRLADQKKADTVIILEKGKKVVLAGVNFETNKATLTSDSRDILTRAYNAMVANPDVSVEISGHTDAVGSQESNQILSLKRAQAVKNWLVQHGIASNRMKTVGKGPNEPVASNATYAGRAENRRIEFYVEQ